MVRTVRKGVGKGFAYFILISFSVICLVPFLWMVSTSLKAKGAIFVFPPEFIPKKWMWSNYVETWTIVPFGTYLKNTVTVAVMSTLGTLISSSLTAYGFARLRFKGREVLFGLLLASMMIPWEITCIPLYVEFNMLGWIDSLKCLIVPSFFGSAFNIFLLRQYFYTIPYDLDEAALIDGCSQLGIYWHIMMPIVRPALVTVAIFQLIGAWNDFMGPLIFLNRQAKFTMTLGLNLFRNAYFIEWHHMMPAATFITLVPLIIFFVGQKHLIGGIATSGLKG